MSANFSGVVHAEGLTLDAGTAAAPSQPQEIIWKRVSDGAAVAHFYAFQTAAGQATQLDISADQADSGDVTVVSIQAPGTVGAQVSVFGGNVGGGNCFVNAQAGSFSKTLLDDVGRSSFLQLLSNQQLQLAYGQGTITWPGGGATSNVMTISHGLGRTPQAITVYCNRVGAGYAVVANNTGSNTTQFFLIATCVQAYNPLNTDTNGFTWMAVG